MSSRRAFIRPEPPTEAAALPPVLRDNIIEFRGCWIWLRSVTDDGYGRLGYAGSRTMAHRLAYESVVGAIPDGFLIDHTCHDPHLCPSGRECVHRRCVNPEHLEPVTHAENVRRGASAAFDTCKRGHPLRRVKRQRYCPTCASQAAQHKKNKQKEQSA